MSSRVVTMDDIEWMENEVECARYLAGLQGLLAPIAFDARKRMLLLHKLR